VVKFVELFVVMLKVKISLETKVQLYLPEFEGKMITTDNKILYCRAHEKHFQVLQHLNTNIHKDNIKAICSSETSVNARSTQRHIPVDDILHSHRCENLKCTIFKGLLGHKNPVPAYTSQQNVSLHIMYALMSGQMFLLTE
jgi:hypothetical protein